MLRILTFGGLSVAHSERELTGAVLQPRRLALLAVMARAGERGVTRERLLNLFWPDDEEDRARRALTQAIYALRRDLGNENAIAGNQELKLDPDIITSDVAEFAQHLKAGRLSEAATLYSGPFLQGFHLVGAPLFERWADDERSALSHEYARTRERLAASAERAGNMTEAVDHWRVLASVDPLNANVAVRYMSALEAIGDRAGALKHARIYEVLVSQELELPPDRAVLELAARLRNAPAPVVKPESVVAAETSGNAATLSVVSPPAAITIDIATPTPTAAESLPAPGVQQPRNLPARSLWSRPTQMMVGAAIVVALAAGMFTQKTAAIDLKAIRVLDTKRVTFEESLELDPALSPDGHTVAYAGGTEGSMKLYVRQVDGGNPVLISGAVPGDHRRPQWSHDGTQILFQAERAIWIVPSLGGSPRVVVEAPRDTNGAALYPAWSPDGKFIAWVEGGAIHSRELSGATPKALARIGNAHSLAWSPDGKYIAAASENAEFVYGARGSLQFAGTRIGNIAPGVIYVVNAASGDTLRVTEPNVLSTSPAWLGDSKTLIYISNKDGARDLYAVAVNAPGRLVDAPVRLTTGLNAHTASIGNDGETIAYTTFRQTANLFSVDIPSGLPVSVKQAQALTSGEQIIEAMDVSPDGQWMAFDSDRSGQQDIYRVHTDGSGETERIVTSPTDDFHPAWSPDGKSIAFYRIRDGVRRGAVVPAAGGAVRFIGPEGGSLEEHSPLWSPDGKQLVFHRFMNGQPALYSTDRIDDSTWRAPERLAEKSGIWPSYSPDGKEIAYFSGAGEISVMSRFGASQHVIVKPGSNGETAMYLRWAPFKKGLLVRARNANGQQAIWEVSVDGKLWRPLVNFDDERRPSLRPEFATDGRRVYFTLAERTADVFTARVAMQK